MTTTKNNPTVETASPPFLISRVFDAPRELVWKAWTERDRLMQWFGPKGFQMTTANLDFRPGGQFHYCLRASDGKEMWGKFVYREIKARERIVFTNSFSDANGGTTRAPFNPNWPLEVLNTVSFTEAGGKTVIDMIGSPFNANDAERAAFESMKPSMDQGFKGTLDQLEAYLASFHKE